MTESRLQWLPGGAEDRQEGFKGPQEIFHDDGYVNDLGYKDSFTGIYLWNIKSYTLNICSLLCTITLQ